MTINTIELTDRQASALLLALDNIDAKWLEDMPLATRDIKEVQEITREALRV